MVIVMNAQKINTEDMLIKAENVFVIRQDKEILKNINLEINHNDFITIIGPNGAGKSMLLKCLLGFFKPDNGNIVRSSDLKAVSYTHLRAHET